MKSKLAIVLTAVLGFAAATYVFAQEAEPIDDGDIEITANTMDNSINAMGNEEAPEEAPVEADSAAPATY